MHQMVLEHNCCAQVGQLAGCTHEGRAAARIQRREAVTDDAGPWASALGNGTALNCKSEHWTVYCKSAHCAQCGLCCSTRSHFFLPSLHLASTVLLQYVVLLLYKMRPTHSFQNI